MSSHICTWLSIENAWEPAINIQDADGVPDGSRWSPQSDHRIRVVPWDRDAGSVAEVVAQFRTGN